MYSNSFLDGHSRLTTEQVKESPRLNTRESTGAGLRLENLTKHFGDLAAVDGIDLEVECGEFVTLLGPSGSGKTTTLLMIAGFESPTEGQILLDDDPITYTPPYQRDVGLVFQHYALFLHMTVFKNIAFPLEMRRLDKSTIQRRVNQALDMVRLRGYGSRYPKQLSGGQQQRIALARSTVFNPRLLLMDEPLGALDKKLREELQLEIKHIQASLGITVIYVTHDQEEALTMSDRIAVMNHGRIEQVGLPHELYERPANRFVADFIGEANFFKGEVITVEGEMCYLRTDDEVVLKGRRLNGVAEGKRLLFAVRPERPVFLDSKKALPNMLEGTIEDLIYVGEATKYKIKTTSGQRFIMKQSSQTGGPQYGCGDSVTIGWKVEDTISLKEEGPRKEEEDGIKISQDEEIDN